MMARIWTIVGLVIGRIVGEEPRDETPYAQRHGGALRCELATLCQAKDNELQRLRKKHDAAIALLRRAPVNSHSSSHDNLADWRYERNQFLVAQGFAVDHAWPCPVAFCARGNAHIISDPVCNCGVSAQASEP
jgi:hypothetical protein